MNSQEKYLKYKNKYNDLKNSLLIKQYGGGMSLTEINNALDRYRSVLTLGYQDPLNELQRNEPIMEIYYLLERKNTLMQSLYDVEINLRDPVFPAPMVLPQPTIAPLKTSSTKELDSIIRRYNNASIIVSEKDVFLRRLADNKLYLTNKNKEICFYDSKLKLYASGGMKGQSISLLGTPEKTQYDRNVLERDNIIQLINRDESGLRQIYQAESQINEIRRNNLVMVLINLRNSVSNLENTLRIYSDFLTPPEDRSRNVIYVKTLTGRSVSINFSTAYLGKHIKFGLYKTLGIPMNEQVLIYIGKEIEDNKTLGENNVQQESILNLVLKRQPVVKPSPPAYERNVTLN